MTAARRMSGVTAVRRMTGVTAAHRAAAAAVWALAATLCAAPAAAHDRSTSHSMWRIDARGADVTLRMTALDREALRADLERRAPPGRPAPPDAAARYVAERLRLLDGDTPCAAAGTPREIDVEPGAVLFRFRVECAGPPGPAAVVESRLLHDVRAAHVHLARIERDGIAVESVLTEDRPRAAVPRRGARPGPSLGGFVALGAEHILGGWDHLLFVAVLLVGCARLRGALLAITGFTLGHSLTLALAALGLATPRAPVVEAMIAATIFVTAVENVALADPRAPRLGPPLVAAAALLALALAAPWLAPRATGAPLALGGLALAAACHAGLSARGALAHGLRAEGTRAAAAALFGLVHGFGFASALRESLPERAHLSTALFGFNAGVELGQLAFATLLFAPLALASRRGARLPVTVAVSACAVAASAWACLTRLRG